jgi:hypothetical protein
MASQAVATGLVVVGLVVLGLGCSRSDAGSSPVERHVDGRSARLLATATAFDLAPAPGGALLAWAPQSGGQIRLGGFATSGATAPPAAPGSVVSGLGVHDLTIAVTQAGVVLAWREAAPAGSVTRGAWLKTDGQTQPFELGPGAATPATSRGGLALAAQAESALLLARGAEAPCEANAPGPCHAFQFYRLSASGARATGVPLTVPGPCDEQAVQLVVAPGRGNGDGEALGRFDYAVCSRASTTPALTVFSIQPNPAYAMAEEVFAGCTPLGAGRFGGEAAFVAVCKGQRRLVTAPEGGQPLVVRDLDRRGLVCRNGAAALAFGSGWLGLNEPIGRLELLLDDDLAPPGSRAVWAGAALLVARLDAAAQLHVASYACRGNTLLEQAEVFDAGT